ncbi:UvrD-helicase domain-containing protein [Zeimonas arvi]|uniref:ATP-dependent DNA helicase Rep n=1 Tax=Zeimonas arvi TaxID=2498847 RepID=A0A5C8NUR5_9BURK|nr:UvrD-helicase domain-containing protein [Zeimonas arvi]TXL64830.1 ATP-dependent DNA helicase Rep [Zeimonas arvi]
MSAQLNPAQREAIRYLDGPCLVIAGAGSGKTRVITQKIVRLIEAGFPSRAIGAITFTNKAAQEMAERLGRMVKLPEAERPLVSTFHSLGVQMLRRDGQALGLKRNFSILDADDAAGILQTALGTTDRKVARNAQHRISLWKNALVDPDAAAATAADELEHQVARAYRDYAATLVAYQAVDFDDLIGLPVRLLREHDEVARAWREKLRYLLVDEYQDTNACQYELLKLLVGPRAGFTAVGDDDQSIYGWRGATLENLNRLSTDFPKLKVIKLEQNYRSSVNILTAANRLIAHNPKLHEKKLWSEHGPGDPVIVVPCDSDEAEAESVVSRLQAHKFERRGKYADYAILYRGNHQARIVEQALRKEKIPYVLSGGQSFFERAEIRDLLAYLRLLANDDDDPAFIRAVTTPKRGVGTTTLTALGTYAGERHQSMFATMFELGCEQRIAPRQLEPLREFGEFVNRIAWRAQREPAAQVLDDLLSAIDYRGHLFATADDKVAAGRWQNVSDFVDWLKKRAEEEGSTLLQLAQTVSLLSQLDRKDADADAVRLTTIHASKGLEFPHVFIVGCEEGLLPHHGGLAREETEAAGADEPGGDEGKGRPGREAARIEEERRLMYVAVTRAQRSLTLTWCRERKRGREKYPQVPSRFLSEMQLDAQPKAGAMVSADAAKAKLAGLRAMLGQSRGTVAG